MIGTHKKQRIRWRKLKAITIAAVIVSMAISTSFCKASKPAAPGKWDNPSETDLYIARRYYEITGEYGDSPVYLERYEKYAPFIRGEVDNIADCEQ